MIPTQRRKQCTPWNQGKHNVGNGQPKPPLIWGEMSIFVEPSCTCETTEFAMTHGMCEL